VVVTESASPSGLGRLTIDAVLQRDYPVIQGVILTIAGVYVLIKRDRPDLFAARPVDRD